MQDFRTRYGIALGAAILLVLLMVSLRASVMRKQETGHGVLTDQDAAFRYAYGQLTKREQELYTALYAGIAAYQTEIRLPDTYTDKEYERVYLLVSMEEPAFFYLDEVYQLADQMQYAEMCYTESGAAADTMKEQLEAAADGILKGISPVMSDGEKLLMIHDGIAQRCRYEKGPHSDDAYGALVLGAARCEGYAKAFAYTAQRLGLRVMCVPGNTVRDAHMWNIAEIGGAYYNVDVTWDDDDRYGGETAHTCFAVPDDLFTDHMPETELFVPPVCTGLSESYYWTHGRIINDAAELAGRLTEWRGVYPLTEFICRDAGVYSDVQYMLKNGLSAGGSGIVFDKERQAVVILP